MASGYGISNAKRPSRHLLPDGRQTGSNSFAEVHFRFGHDSGGLVGAESQIVSAMPTFRGLIVRLETAKGGHEVFDLAGRRGFAGFEVALNA